MSGDTKLLGLHDMSQVSEARLWKTLDLISNRLTGIESHLSELVRLEERVNNHEQALSRYGNRLDNHDTRLRESEIWQANFGDRSSVERLVANVQTEVVNLKNTINTEVGNLKVKVDSIESISNISKGQKDVGKEVLKWACGILAALLIYKITKG